MEREMSRVFDILSNMPGMNEMLKVNLKLSKEQELLLYYLELRLKFLEELLKKENHLDDASVDLFNNGNREKCCSSLSKSDLVQFFYLLMDEGILFFDPIDKVRNRSKMQEFITGNFTYYGDAGNQKSMSTVSKQFSESKGYTYKEKQLCFLNGLILVIEKRKEKLIKW